MFYLPVSFSFADRKMEKLEFSLLDRPHPATAAQCKLVF